MSLAGLVVGALLMLAGLGTLVLSMTASVDPDLGRSLAEQDAAAMTDTIAGIESELRHETVLAAARLVPAEAPEETEALVEALAARGVTDPIDVRVFPPRVEDIEVGTYPDPDFAVVQMLVEARRRGSAPARIRHQGTADEHLAFAVAAHDDADEAEAIVLLRLPAGRILEQMTSPDRGAWVRLVQGSQVLSSLPDETTADLLAAGRQTIDGSALAIEWGVPQRSGLSPAQSVLLIVAGLLAAIAGVALRSGAVARLLAPSADKEPSEAPAVAMPAADRPPPAAPPGPAPAAADADKTVAETPEAAEPKPDLPDWLLDEGDSAQELPFGDSDESAARKTAESAPSDRTREADSEADEPSREEAPAPSPDAGLELDVPDLDEILAQIEEASESESMPASAEDQNDVGGDREFALAEPDDGLDDRLDPDASGPASAEEQPESPLDEELSLAGLDEVLDDHDESAADRDSGDEPPPELPGDDGPLPSLEPDAAELASEEPVDDEFDMEMPAAELDSAPGDHAVDTAAEPPPESERQESDEVTRLLAVVEQSERFSPGLFKTDGIRGIVDRSLDAEHAAILGQAIGTMAAGLGHQTIAVGRDGRVSGPLMMSAMIRGLRTAGMDVIEAGSVPAPALWYAASEMADGCGVMVSASHHGPAENGFQVMLGGRMLGREQLLEIAALAIEGEFAEGDGAYAQENVARAYATALADTVELKRPLKVVVDCGNGIAGSIVPVLLQALDIDLIPLYCDVDGSFPNHRPDPTDPECLEDLRLCVRNFRADLGFAFDGDGDRLALVSSDSEVAGADQVLMLLARALLAREPGAAVVMDVRCAARLEQMVREAGGRPVLAPAGSVPVARATVEEQAVLGGDMDGQFIVASGWYPFGDAICAAVRLLELFADGQQSVQGWLEDLPESRTTGALPLALEAAAGHRVIQRLHAETDFGDARVTTIDGVRVAFPDRWGLMRVTADDGNVELRFGGHDPTALNQIKTEFRDWLLAVDPDIPLPY